METAPGVFNILERIVVEKIHDWPEAKVAPRILVRRLSLMSDQLGPWFDRVEDRPGYPISKLIAAEGQVDWMQSFRLDPLANKVEREVIELDFPHYSRLERDSRSEILFSFTAPISDGKGGSLLYGVADRGFLWAHGFLCSFEGSFETPENMEFLNIWRS